MCHIEINFHVTCVICAPHYVSRETIPSLHHSQYDLKYVQCENNVRNLNHTLFLYYKRAPHV